MLETEKRTDLIRGYYF